MVQSTTPQFSRVSFLFLFHRTPDRAKTAKTLTHLDIQVHEFPSKLPASLRLVRYQLTTFSMEKTFEANNQLSILHSNSDRPKVPKTVLINRDLGFQTRTS